MDNDFLHKIDLETLKKEVGLSIEEIGNLAQLKNPKGVYNWSKDKANNGTRPPYNAVIRLLEKGATVETLFGVEYRGRSVPAEVAGNPEFLAGVEHALTDMKARGIIREEVEQAIADMKAKGQL